MNLGKVLFLVDSIGYKYPEHIWDMEYTSSPIRSIRITVWPDHLNNNFRHKIDLVEILDIKSLEDFARRVDELISMLYDIDSNGIEALEKYGCRHCYFDENHNLIKGEE